MDLKYITHIQLSLTYCANFIKTMKHLNPRIIPVSSSSLNQVIIPETYRAVTEKVIIVLAKCLYGIFSFDPWMLTNNDDILFAT